MTSIEDLPVDGSPTDPLADAYAARMVAGQALTHVGRVSGRRPLRAALRWISRDRLGGPSGWPVVPKLDTPWQDTISGTRDGWRQRTAFLDELFVFSVDYRICRRCRIAWVEEPYTVMRYQRCGVATAALAALRHDNPGLQWHTWGGHLARQFWAAGGVDVAGGYQQHPPCPHVTN
jgi:hypothetical protein